MAIQAHLLVTIQLGPAAPPSLPLYVRTLTTHMGIEWIPSLGEEKTQIAYTGGLGCFDGIGPLNYGGELSDPPPSQRCDSECRHPSRPAVAVETGKGARA